MEQEQTIKNNRVIFQVLAVGILFSLLLMITNNIRITFNLSAMVGGLTYAAAFEGLRRAYKHYKDGKQIIRALRVAFSWINILCWRESCCICIRAPYVYISILVKVRKVVKRGVFI